MGYVDDCFKAEEAEVAVQRLPLVQQKIFGFAVRRILHAVQIRADKSEARHAQFKVFREFSEER